MLKLFDQPFRNPCLLCRLAISTEIQHPATIGKVSLSRHWPNDGFVETFNSVSKVEHQWSTETPTVGLRYPNGSTVRFLGPTHEITNPFISGSRLCNQPVDERTKIINPVRFWCSWMDGVKSSYGPARGDPDVWIGLDHLCFGSKIWIGNMDRTIG